MSRSFCSEFAEWEDSLSRSSRRLQEPGGPWGLAFSILKHPGFFVALILSVAAAGLLGTHFGLGEHPAEGLMLRLPLAILPFSLVAVSRSSQMKLTAYLVATAIVLILIGSWPATGRSGRLELGPSSSENYTQYIAGRSVRTHLGAPVVAKKDQNSIILTMGLADRVSASAEVPIDPRSEVALGPYLVRYEGTRAGRDDDIAVVTLTERQNPKVIRTFEASLNRTVPIGADGQLTVKSVRGDFLKALGAAAQIEVVWKDSQETAWHFVDGEGLDARTGQSPWIVRLDRVKAGPVHQFSIRRAGLDPLVWGGVCLLLVASVLSFRSNREVV